MGECVLRVLLLPFCCWLCWCVVEGKCPSYQMAGQLRNALTYLNKQHQHNHRHSQRHSPQLSDNTFTTIHLRHSDSQNSSAPEAHAVRQFNYDRRSPCTEHHLKLPQPRETDHVSKLAFFAHGSPTVPLRFSRDGQLLVALSSRTCIRLPSHVTFAFAARQN